MQFSFYLFFHFNCNIVKEPLKGLTMQFLLQLQLFRNISNINVTENSYNKIIYIQTNKVIYCFTLQYKNIYIILAEVPGAGRVNFNLLNIFCFQKCVLQLKGFQAHQAQSGKPAPKPSLDRCGCSCKISLRSRQGLKLPLAFHIPTDRQTSVRPLLYICMESYYFRRALS